MSPRVGSPFLRQPAAWIATGLILTAMSVTVLYLLGVFMPGFETTKLGTIDYNITYCTVDDENLEMDIYYPNTDGPWPALIYVHGGGWTEGDKMSVLTSPTEAGFLVASINYRMYPAYQFPAMIEDVKCAIRFLRAHASQYNIDPDRFALIGHSAGGHLVALAGLADERAGWDVGQYRGQSSRVQAVVIISGPSNLQGIFSQEINDLIQNVFGSDQLISGSPVAHVSPDDPPFMIIHGEADVVVPVEQAYFLHDALLQAGVPVELVIVKNGGHGLEPVTATGTTPSSDAIFTQVIRFLNQNLENP